MTKMHLCIIFQRKVVNMFIFVRSIVCRLAYFYNQKLQIKLSVMGKVNWFFKRIRTFFNENHIVCRAILWQNCSCKENINYQGSVRSCPDGGIGRRVGLKIRFLQGSVGSIPSPGTISKLRYEKNLRSHVRCRFI